MDEVYVVDPCLIAPGLATLDQRSAVYATLSSPSGCTSALIAETLHVFDALTVIDAKSPTMIMKYSLELMKLLIIININFQQVTVGPGRMISPKKFLPRERSL